LGTAEGQRWRTVVCQINSSAFQIFTLCAKLQHSV